MLGCIRNVLICRDPSAMHASPGKSRVNRATYILHQLSFVHGVDDEKSRRWGFRRDRDGCGWSRWQRAAPDCDVGPAEVVRRVAVLCVHAVLVASRPTRRNDKAASVRIISAEAFNGARGGIQRPREQERRLAVPLWAGGGAWRLVTAKGTVVQAVLKHNEVISREWRSRLYPRTTEAPQLLLAAAASSAAAAAL
jgi:hypothetical protein